jgi:hypothetical protein
VYDRRPVEPGRLALGQDLPRFDLKLEDDDGKRTVTDLAAAVRSRPAGVGDFDGHGFPAGAVAHASAGLH